MTLGGAFTPGKIKDGISRAATDYLSAVLYLSIGSGRDERVGQLFDLVDHVAASHRYERIVVLAYSWGSVIALDAFFPPNRLPGPRLADVETLVTIGCPFDLVRTFWRRYYSDRQTRAGAPRQWLNVWSPMDALSSNFRDDPEKNKPAQVPIAAVKDSAEPMTPDCRVWDEGPLGEKLTVGKAFQLMGLRAHSKYWEREYRGETGCFTLIVPAMLEAAPQS
jgi:pimeloyl-ACP methyl ester carboxylesterase